MKNIIKKSALCAVLFVLLSAVLLAACNSNGQGGAIGKGEGWTLAENGTITVSGSGNMPTVDTDAYDKSPWYAVKDRIKKAVISDGITDIAPTAFAECAYLESVSIPKSVTYISENAFADSMRLQSITVPDSVTAIGNGAFSCCRGLKTVVFEGAVETVGNNAFTDCDSVESVTLANGLKSIGNSAFGFGRIGSLTLPEGLETIGESAFIGCRALKEISLPASVTSLGNGAFPLSIEKISYGGTVEQWQALTAGIQLGFEEGFAEITCEDGTVTVGSAPVYESSGPSAEQSE